MNEHWHGTANGYLNRKCRCEPCKAAAADYRRQWRAKAIAAGAPVKLHGTRTGYQAYRCRCLQCRVAGARYLREYRARVRLVTAHLDLDRLTDGLPEAAHAALRASQRLVQVTTGHIPRAVADAPRPTEEGRVERQEGAVAPVAAPSANVPAIGGRGEGSGSV